METMTPEVGQEKKQSVELEALGGKGQKLFEKFDEFDMADSSDKKFVDAILVSLQLNWNGVLTEAEKKFESDSKEGQLINAAKDMFVLPKFTRAPQEYVPAIAEEKGLGREYFIMEKKEVGKVLGVNLIK